MEDTRRGDRRNNGYNVRMRDAGPYECTGRRRDGMESEK